VARWFKVLHRDGELERVVERVTENLTDPRVLEVFCVAAWATFSSPEGIYDGICTQVQSHARKMIDAYYIIRRSDCCMLPVRYQHKSSVS
jgi:hypothetical protein